MKTYRVAAALLLFAYPRTAAAEPTLKAIPEGEDNITVVVEGQKAPHSGQLFDTPTALRWGNYLEQCQVRLKADVELAERTEQAHTQFWKTKSEAQDRQYLVVTEDYQKQVADLTYKVNNPPFYKTMWFGVLVGVVTAGTLVGVTAYGLNAAN